MVGGGFGGLYTALKVKEQSPSTAVTLVDPKDKFVFLPLLYELAVGSASVVEVAPRYEDLLRGTGIRFVQGSVEGVDLDDKIVRLSSSQSLAERLEYDKLVVACGAQPNLGVIPGADEFALAFCRVEDAYRLRTELRALSDNPDSTGPIRVAVLGGGYSGVEVATTLSEYLGRDRAKVTILDRNEYVMHSSPAYNRLEAERVLRASGVELQCGVSVVRVTSSGVEYRPSPSSSSSPSPSSSQDEFLPADLVVATLGTQQAALTQALGVAKDGRSGRILVDRSMRSSSHPDSVFSLGDCCVIAGEAVPSTAQAAMQQADIVSKNVLCASDSPSDLRQFSFVPLGEMLTLGTKDAAVSSLGGLVELQGLAASVARRFVYAMRMPTPHQRLSALVSSAVVMGANEVSKLLMPPPQGNGKRQ